MDTAIHIIYQNFIKFLENPNNYLYTTMKQIPLFKVFISPNIDKPLLDVLHSGFIGEGDAVKEFEYNLSQFLHNHPKSI